MFKIYEIRNKKTHRIEYLNLFEEGEKPNEEFKANPDSLAFADRLDLYVSVREETFTDKDLAWAECMKLFVKYKLMPPERLQENIDKPKKAQPLTKAKKATKPKTKQ